MGKLQNIEGPDMLFWLYHQFFVQLFQNQLYLMGLGTTKNNDWDKPFSVQAQASNQATPGVVTNSNTYTCVHFPQVSVA